jgi:hypothetical protein
MTDVSILSKEKLFDKRRVNSIAKDAGRVTERIDQR